MNGERHASRSVVSDSRSGGRVTVTRRGVANGPHTATLDQVRGAAGRGGTGARRASRSRSEAKAGVPDLPRKAAPRPPRPTDPTGGQHLPESRVSGYAGPVVDHLVGVSEIAHMLGVSRQRAVQVVGDYADFPAPVSTLASGRIWEREAVEAWITAHPDRKPGRRPKSETAATEAEEEA